MPRQSVRSKQFKKDVANFKVRGGDIEELKKVLDLLIAGEQLPLDAFSLYVGASPHPHGPAA